jgi:hypothetical protein
VKRGLFVDNGDRIMGTGPIFVRERIFSTCGQNIIKWGLSPFNVPF